MKLKDKKLLFACFMTVINALLIFTKYLNSEQARLFIDLSA
jgi:hypothetical protein